MNYLKLKPGDLWTHYFSVAFFCMIVAASLLPPLFVGRNVRGNEMYSFAAVAAVMAGLSYVIQKRALRFSRFETPHEASQNYASVVALADSEGWQIVHRRQERLLVMAVPGFPKSLGSWGERITVEFHTAAVAVNSICDPARHPSVVSFGRNRRNVKAVAEAVDGCVSNT